MASNTFHCDKVSAKTSQPGVRQRRSDDGTAAGVHAKSCSPNDIYHNHRMSTASDRVPSQNFEAERFEDSPAQKVLHQLQEQMRSHCSQLSQLRQQEVLGGLAGASVGCCSSATESESENRGSLGTLPGGCAPTTYSRDDTRHGRRYSIGQTLPQKLPSQIGRDQRHRRSESESLPSLMAESGDRIVEHSCILKQLDTLVQYQQQQLLEVQQKQPLDMALLEKIYWEQKKITRVCFNYLLLLSSKIYRHKTYSQHLPFCMSLWLSVSAGKLRTTV